MRQSDEYPARVALLRTRLHIELRLQQPENTLLGYTLQAMWGDSIPSAEAMITAAGGHYDQTPTAVMSRKTAAMAAANVNLKKSAEDLLKERNARKREKREWGLRAYCKFASELVRHLHRWRFK